MDVDTHNVAFSFDQPEKVLQPLHAVTKQMLSQSTIRTAKILPLINGRTVLIIDLQKERAAYLEQLLSSVGYRAIVASTALEAFTLFLQKTYVPFVVVLGQEDGSTNFFLHRLIQQVSQKYEWDVPLLRLSRQRNLPVPQPVTAPIKQLPIPIASSGTITTPISPAASQLATSLLPSEERPHQPAAKRAIIASTQLSSTQVQVRTDRAQLSLEGLDIGRFQIHNRLGNELSTTYRVYDRLREQYVALKAIQTTIDSSQPTAEFSAELTFFQREQELLDTLNHPHILSIATCGKSYVSGAIFMYKTLLYCAKGSLADWQRTHKALVLSPKEVAPFIAKLGDALQCAHDHNVLFLNFKLSNILLRGEGGGIERLHGFFVDFAIASHETSFTRVLGTFPYKAPECWNGQPLPVSDQYGLAAITYELLTGRPPFQGQSERIMKHLHTNMAVQPPGMYNRYVSPALDRVLLRALAKRPEDRFGSVLHFIRAFQGCC